MKGYIAINIFFFQILLDDPKLNGFVKIHLNHMHFLCNMCLKRCNWWFVKFLNPIDATINTSSPSQSDDNASLSSFLPEVPTSTCKPCERPFNEQLHQTMTKNQHLCKGMAWLLFQKIRKIVENRIEKTILELVQFFFLYFNANN